jgi:hypothetical protein
MGTETNLDAAVSGIMILVENGEYKTIDIEAVKAGVKRITERLFM